MDEADIRTWAANKALEHHGALTPEAEIMAGRLFAFVAVGSFDHLYTPAERFGYPVRPFPAGAKSVWIKA